MESAIVGLRKAVDRKHTLELAGVPAPLPRSNYRVWGVLLLQATEGGDAMNWSGSVKEDDRSFATLGMMQVSSYEGRGRRLQA